MGDQNCGGRGSHVIYPPPLIHPRRIRHPRKPECGARSQSLFLAHVTMLSFTVNLPSEMPSGNWSRGGRIRGNAQAWNLLSVSRLGALRCKSRMRPILSY